MLAFLRAHPPSNSGSTTATKGGPGRRNKVFRPRRGRRPALGRRRGTEPDQRPQAGGAEEEGGEGLRSLRAFGSACEADEERQRRPPRGPLRQGRRSAPDR